MDLHKNAPDTLITTYLEMTSPTDFLPGYLSEAALAERSATVLPMAVVDVPYYRFLYNSVGDIWGWRDRRLMSDDELYAALSQPGTRVDVLFVSGVPAGYVELARHGDSIEVAYLGLRPAYNGLGLGKHLLSYGLARAWEAEPKRVFVHTCNLDGPYALENYVKRGFKTYRVDQEPMPERYLQP